jgi:energy-coupling factor transporter ATP-binding protein EcfA2
MKIKKLLLQNFKVFGPNAPEIDFCDELGLPQDMICIVGDNGSGKSTVLQAIAMLLGSATRRSMKPSDLDWPGFNYEYLSRSGLSPIAELTVELDPEEIAATSDFAAELRDKGSAVGVPSHLDEIKLRLDRPGNKVLAASPNAFFQLSGRQYALQLNRHDSQFLNTREHHSSRLKQVGGVYWYTEQRTSISFLSPQESLDGRQMPASETQLRTMLQSWTAFHDMRRRPGFVMREGQRDYFEALNDAFSTVFPGRSLVGSMPQPDPELAQEPSQFWFRDEQGLEYELSSLSAGERAILPILIDFANWEIHHSIILIDEVELHLHPPLQQLMVRALGNLARTNDNQIIVTTHSDHVVTSYGDQQLIRIS